MELKFVVSEKKRKRILEYLGIKTLEAKKEIKSFVVTS